MATKIFDNHIGPSDTAVLFSRNLLEKGNISESDHIAWQFDSSRLMNSSLDTFCGMICPIELTSKGVELPDNPFSFIRKHLAVYDTFFSKNKSLVHVKESADLSNPSKKIIVGVEGVYWKNQSKRDIQLFLEELYTWGIRVIGPYWNNDNGFIKNGKVSSYGNYILGLMDEMGFVLDVAHAEAYGIDLLVEHYSDSRVFSSHTNLGAFSKHRRCISDNAIRYIVDKEGYVSISFVGEFLAEKSIQGVVDQIEYLVNNFGPDSVAIGSDFEGMEYSDIIPNLEDITQYHNLGAELKKRLDISIVEKILYKTAEAFFRKAL